MARPSCCDKVGLKKGSWSAEEDEKLLAYIQQHGHGSWRTLPEKAGLQRCGKSCRLRWNNYLRPDIKRGKFSLKEDQTIIQLHALLGNRWSAIASHLPKRTDNDIKNYWNTHLRKRLNKMGIDPATHKPKANIVLSPGQQKVTAHLNHMAQWERARLEAEARLTRQSKMLSITLPFQNKLASPTPCLDVLRVWRAAGMTNDTANNQLSHVHTSRGTLLSPTFSDYNMFMHPCTASFGLNLQPFPVINQTENSSKLLQVGTTKEHNARCIGIPVDDEQLEVEDNASIQLLIEDFEYHLHPLAADATNVRDDWFIRHHNLMEGNVSVLLQDNIVVLDDSHEDGYNPSTSGIEESFKGNLEDYRKYWTNMIDDSGTFTCGVPPMLF